MPCLAVSSSSCNSNWVSFFFSASSNFWVTYCWQISQKEKEKFEVWNFHKNLNLKEINLKNVEILWMKVFTITGHSLFDIEITWGRPLRSSELTCRQGTNTMKGPCIFLDCYSLTDNSSHYLVRLSGHKSKTESLRNYISTGIMVTLKLSQMHS